MVHHTAPAVEASGCARAVRHHDWTVADGALSEEERTMAPVAGNRYSGITPQQLEAVDTRLCQVQAALLRVVGARDILVGHSLENDLKALKMVHGRCLDTSLLYPHPKKGRRSSLKFLASM